MLMCSRLRQKLGLSVRWNRTVSLTSGEKLVRFILQTPELLPLQTGSLIRILTLGKRFSLAEDGCPLILGLDGVSEGKFSVFCGNMVCSS